MFLIFILVNLLKFKNNPSYKIIFSFFPKGEGRKKSDRGEFFFCDNFGQRDFVIANFPNFKWSKSNDHCEISLSNFHVVYNLEIAQVL